MLKQGPERWTVLEPFNGTLYPDINDSRNWDPRTGWTDVTMLALTDGTGTARTLTLTALQDALAAWEARNFAPVNPLHRALGVAEEAGELCHAVLKRDQGIRGTHEGHTAKIRDAIGDIAIFCMQICSAEGLRAEDVFAVHPSATAYYLDTQEALRSWSIMNDTDETLPHDIVRYALCLAAFAGSLCDTFSSRAPPLRHDGPARASSTRRNSRYYRLRHANMYARRLELRRGSARYRVRRAGPRVAQAVIVVIISHEGVYYTVRVQTPTGVVTNEADMVEVETARAFAAWLRSL
jgi:NTP pyrophosphatase (non-canonical NTP hydrolase)